jgi:hypothetical protein
MAQPQSPTSGRTISRDLCQEWHLQLLAVNVEDLASIIDDPLPEHVRICRNAAMGGLESVVSPFDGAATESPTDRRTV